MIVSQVTVAVVRYDALDRDRVGVTSTLLAERLQVRPFVHGSTGHAVPKLLHAALEHALLLCLYVPLPIDCASLVCDWFGVLLQASSLMSHALSTSKPCCRWASSCRCT